MKLSLITAMSQNKVIGKEGSLPWHFPSDLHYFKNMTRGKPVIMGRRTFESPDMPKPLPNRRNIVVTSDQNYSHPGIEVVQNLHEALGSCEGESEAVVIGGRGLYAEAYDIADRLYITLIQDDYDGDVYFPVDIDWTQFDISAREVIRENETTLAFIVAERKEQHDK